MITSLKYNCGLELATPIISIGEKDWVRRSEPMDVYTKALKIDIYGYDENDQYYNEQVIVGEMLGTFFNVNQAVIDGESVFDIFDSLSSDAAALYSEIFKDNEDFSEIFELNYNVFDIEYVLIYEQYRNIGIGSFTINQLYNILLYNLSIDVGCFTTIPLPTTVSENSIKYSRDDKKVIARLRKFMRNCGYRSLNKSEYLYKNNERKDINLNIIK